MNCERWLRVTVFYRKTILYQYRHHWKQGTVRSPKNGVRRLGNKIMVLKEGGMQAYGKPCDVMTGHLLQSVYDMDVTGYMVESLKMWEGLKK